MSLTIIPAEFLPPIDGVVIGGITPAAGSFTTLNATGGSELGNRVAANGVQPRYDLIESDTANVNTRFSNTGGSLLIQTINDALDTATTRLTIDHTTGAATLTAGITATTGTFSGAVSMGTTNALLVKSGINSYIDSGTDSANANIFVTGAGTGDFSSEAGHLVIQPRVQGTVYRDIIFASGITTADPILRLVGEGNAQFYGALGVTGAATFTDEINTNSSGVIKTIGGDLAMVQGAIGLRINTASNAISPTTATLNNDAAVDIGVNNIRFRNAFLSGTVNAGAAAFTGDIELSGANAEINLKSGVGGTSGAINWTFNTGTTNFASIKLPYDTRNTLGLHLDAGYPITIDASTYIAFAASGVENMHLTASGNLGVGVTPSAWNTSSKAIQAGAAAALWGLDAVVGTILSDNLYYTAGTTRVRLVSGAASEIQQASGQIEFKTTATGGTGTITDLTTKMTLVASGNLGVGITPDALTRVHAHGSADVASFTQTNSANSQRLEMGNAFSLITSGNGAMSAIVSDSILLFGIGSTEHMRLITSGNLLLGTTTSSAKLSVVGDGSAQPIAQFKGGTAGDLAVAGLHISKFDNNNTTSQILARFYMNQGGTAQGMITANGASAAAFTAFSDATLKENITTLPDQYDNIRALRPVEFDYIESEGGGHQVGFIAQEMQAVYPCCVGEREDGKLTITGWSKTEARLVSALRSAMDKIDVLTARLDAAGL
jgi:hypothetical protein